MYKKLERGEENNFVTAPPKTITVLETIAKGLKRKISISDARVPRDPYDLAIWWIKMQSRPNEFYDRPKQESKKNGSGYFWKTPYTDRILFNMIRFFNQEKGYQSLIIAAAAEGIFWRNDDRSYFMGLISENDKMKKVGVKKYREEAMKKMGQLRLNKSEVETLPDD